MREKINFPFWWGALSFIIIGGLIAQSPALAQITPTAPNSPAGSNDSYNWAGYVASGSGYSSVSGSWIIPQIPTTNNFTADAAWVGIGGVSNQDLIQVGTQAINNGSSTTYQPWYEVLPAVSSNIPMSVNPGDSISASITEASSNQWIISLRDNTNGQNFQTSVNYNSSGSSVEWIEEMPSQGIGSFIPLDNFGTVQFSGASAVENGQTLNLSQANAQPMTMLNLSQQVLAQPSALNSDNAGFSVSRTSAQAAQAVTKLQGFGHSRWRRDSSGIQRLRHQAMPGQAPTTYITLPTIPGMQRQTLNMLRQQLQLMSQFSNMRIGFSYSR